MRTTYSGIPASPGIGMGLTFIYRPCLSTGAPSIHAIEPHTPWDEWQYFLTVQSKVDEELEHLELVSSRLLADIFSAQRAILHDKTLLDAVRSAIYQSSATAAQATHLSVTELANLFRGMEDEYFASHAAEIVDIGQRLLAHLEPQTRSSQLTHLSPDTVLIAEELTLGDAMQMNIDHVSAVALVNSAPTAHLAILARSLEVPLVCALDHAILDVPPSCTAIVDGNSGILVIDPSKSDDEFYTNTQKYHLRQQQRAESQAQSAAITRDGVFVAVCANINDVDATQLALDRGADGIGLLRTEFLFLQRETPPSATEQTESYRQIADCMAAEHQKPGQSALGKEIIDAYVLDQPQQRMLATDRLRTLTIRLLDAGGDKPLPFIPETQRTSSFLGRRGIRLLLEHPYLLETQIEAILKMAAHCPDLRIMVPMASSIAEIQEVKRIIVHKGAELFKNRAPSTIALGLLVEVPAAALMADQLATEVDFFSIGTNDLAQYVLAADRADPHLAGLADPLHPAVLQLINLVCHSAQVASIPVSLCGTIASDPNATALLLGLGLTELSVSSAAIPLVKQAVRQCDLLRCRQLAEQALQCSTPAQVHALISH